MIWSRTDSSISGRLGLTGLGGSWALAGRSKTKEEDALISIAGFMGLVKSSMFEEIRSLNLVMNSRAEC